MENDRVQILFDNPNGLEYYSGQTLSGRVECVFSKEIKVRAVRIKFQGKAKTKFLVTDGICTTTTTEYRGEQVYFDKEFNLMKRGDADFMKFPAGIYSFRFSCTLPQDLPSYFCGQFGNIRYTVKATVSRPGWKSNYHDEVLLKIISPLDLNNLLTLREPVATSLDKKLICCCWNSGQITFTVSLPVTGFVCGQQLGIKCSVQNMSNFNLELVVYKIIEKIQFFGTSPRNKRKDRKYTAASKNEQKHIAAHTEKGWISDFEVPTDVNFTNLAGCSIINVSYRLEVKLVVPSPLHSNMTVSFPITIGTKPLLGGNTSHSSPGPIHNLNSSNLYRTSPSAPDATSGDN